LGIRQFQASLDVLANNLANLNTVGYKASRADFVESLNSVLRAPTPDTATASGTSGVTVGNGVATAAIRSNFSQGSINQSGLATDFSITGNGYFLVRNSSSGEVFATRSGNFRLDSAGYLVTDGGLRVQGVEDYQKSSTQIGDIRFNKGTVPSDAGPTAATAAITNISVDGSGRLNTLLDDGTQYVRAQMVLQSFSNEQALVRAGNNLFTNLGASGASVADATTPFTSTPSSSILNGTKIPNQDGMGRIEQGSLELSNVDVSREFSNMITTQRAFQASARMITTSDSILEELVNLKR
ncbi:MAG: Flagellar basal-body rod protein FlgG, partial [Verrucomicrobiota bacterium]